MSTVARIAWRNLWRHRARTITMVSTVSLTYALLLLSMGLNDDGHQQMLDAAARGAGGDVLIHARGYWETGAPELVVRAPEEVLARMEGIPGVRLALSRFLVEGLVSSAAAHRAIQLRGIDPESEQALWDLTEDVSAGSLLGPESPDDAIVLGSEVVEALELELGDRVVLTATDPEGEIRRALFHLSGVVRTGLSEVDNGLGLTRTQTLAAAMGLADARTQIGLLVEPGTDVDAVADELRAALVDLSEPLEVLSWREAVPEMVAYVQIDDGFLYLFMVVIFAIVGLAIANTFLMAVMERVREFGLLGALGLRGGRIAGLLMLETVFLVAVGMAVGLTLALTGHAILQEHGLSVAMWGVEEMELSGVDASDLVIHSHIRPFKWILSSILVALATIGSGLYPAAKAARLTPASAMRFTA